MSRRKPPASRTLVSDARDAVAHCAGANLRLAARQVTRFLDSQLQVSGLSLAQFGLMTHIAAAEDDTIGALAERIGLDQSTLSRNLRALDKAGLVEIAVVEKDLRRRAVWLTETGAKRLAEAMPIWREAQKTLSAFVDPRVVQALATATAALADGERTARQT